MRTCQSLHHTQEDAQGIVIAKSYAQKQPGETIVLQMILI